MNKFLRISLLPNRHYIQLTISLEIKSKVYDSMMEQNFFVFFPQKINRNDPRYPTCSIFYFNECIWRFRFREISFLLLILLYLKSIQAHRVPLLVRSSNVSRSIFHVHCVLKTPVSFSIYIISLVFTKFSFSLHGCYWKHLYICWKERIVRRYF